MAGWAVSGVLLAGLLALLGGPAAAPPESVVATPAPTPVPQVSRRPPPPTLERDPTPEPYRTPEPPPPTVAALPETPPPQPTPTPLSEADLRRQVGTRALEASLQGLAPRLTGLREQLQLHRNECNNVAWARANPADCERIEQMLRQGSRALAAAVEAAEESARQAGVEPGVRRQRRAAVRLGEDDLDALNKEIEAGLPH